MLRGVLWAAAVAIGLCAACRPPGGALGRPPARAARPASGPAVGVPVLGPAVDVPVPGSAVGVPVPGPAVDVPVPGALAVAGRFAVLFVSGAGPDQLAALSTPDLAAGFRLAQGAAPPPAPFRVAVRSAVEDDAGPDGVGVAVAVAWPGGEEQLDILTVETPVGWRVAAVEL